MNQSQSQQQQQIQEQEENGIVTKQKQMDMYAMSFIVTIIIVSVILIFFSTEKSYLVAEGNISNRNMGKFEDLDQLSQLQSRIQKIIEQKCIQEKIQQNLTTNTKLLFEIYDLNSNGIIENDEYKFPQYKLEQMNRDQFTKYVKKNPKQLLFKFQESLNKESSIVLNKSLSFRNSQLKEQQAQIDKINNDQFLIKLIQNQAKYGLFMEWLFNLLDENKNDILDFEELKSDFQFKNQKFLSINKDKWKEITINLRLILLSKQGNQNEQKKNISSQIQKQSKEQIQISYYNNFDFFFQILNKINLL